MNTKINNYIATFILHALGDTIGFKNYDWESDYGRVTTLDTINEYVYEFIDLGGVNGIDLEGWFISDDTMYHVAFANTLLNYKGKHNKELMIHAKDNLIKTYNNMILDSKNLIRRFTGNTTTERYLKKFTDDIDGRNLPYDPNTGGNGVSSRCLCIGLAFYKDSDLKTLVNLSIELSRLTHNSPLGFLAGLTTAYFTSLAIREVEVYKWPMMLVNLLESTEVKQYINSKNNDIQIDYLDYIRYWKKYLDTRFSNDKPIKTRSIRNLIFRIKYYYENFVKGTKSTGIGMSGFCATIMAYDALLDCDGKWEKLIFYAILNPGDSDTIGAVAGGLYGAVYGFGDVPKNMLEHLEKTDELNKLGKTFYKKFYKL